MIISSVNKKFYFLSSLFAFHLFFLLYCTLQAFSTMSSRRGESGHLCLGSDLWGKACHLALLSMMLAAGVRWKSFRLGSLLCLVC